MTDNQRFTQMLAEFRRVGVDPDTFSAVITVTPAEAMRVLATLEDGAGPAAFLARLREVRGVQHSPPEGVPAQRGSDAPSIAPASSSDARRRA